ncbi:MAG: HNH/endonuclease VII fold putative polymorphic toxin [Planctomycetaceae bacterium]
MKKILGVSCLLLSAVLILGSALAAWNPAPAPDDVQPGLAAMPARLPIEQVSVGTRVKGYNPDRSDAQLVSTPNPNSWYTLYATMSGESGQPVEVTLLRPLEWLEEAQAIPGEEVWLELPEMHIAGWAFVEGIDECPEVQTGLGPVVTGTFKHDADAVVDLQFEEQSEVVTCTPDHPFWSELRQEFVPASELMPGEAVATSTGHPAILTSITPRDGPITVYGLEVYGEHVYHVSSQGLLVHNVSQNTPKSKVGRSSAFRAAKRDAGIPRGQQPKSVTRVPMTDKFGNKILGADGKPVMTREYEFSRPGKTSVVIQDHSAGHSFGERGVGDQGPHFNVRPIENTRTGVIPGTQAHYNFDK